MDDMALDANTAMLNGIWGDTRVHANDGPSVGPVSGDELARTRSLMAVDSEVFE